jgi:hypothetical protein
VETHLDVQTVEDVPEFFALIHVLARAGRDDLDEILVVLPERRRLRRVFCDFVALGPKLWAVF